MKKRDVVKITIQNPNDLQHVKPFDGLEVFISSTKEFYYWDKSINQFTKDESGSGSGRITYIESDVQNYRDAVGARAEAFFPTGSSLVVASTIPGEEGNEFYLYVDSNITAPNQPLSVRFEPAFEINGFTIPTVIVSLGTDGNGQLDPVKNKMLEIYNLTLPNFDIYYNGASAHIMETSVGPLQFWGGENVTEPTPGIKGDIKFNDYYLFICVDTNTWKGINLRSLTDLYD